MKILVDCTPLSKGGGVQVAIAFLLNLLRTDGQWLAVIPAQMLPYLPGNLSQCNNISTISKANYLDIFLINRILTQTVRDFKPDVVFTVFGPPYFLANVPHVCGFALPNMIYARSPPLPNKHFSELAIDLLRIWILRRLGHLIVETETARNRLQQLLGSRQQLIHVVGNSVNPVHLDYFASRGALPSKSDIKRVLVPSAYYRHKNLELVPKLCVLLREKKSESEFTFVLTIPVHSREWMAIRNNAAALGVERHVTTLGNLSLGQLAKEYIDCDCVFLPTLREVSTAVYPESFFFKRPLVTSDLDFARELCGDAAMYAAPDDAEACVDQLIKVLFDPECAARLVARGTRQLTAAYLTAAEKFTQQMRVLELAIQGAPHPLNLT